MKPIKIEIENFMAFGPGPHILPLADLGLILIEGENQFSKTQQSNGAGKTTIAEAFAWCIFGKTSKDVAADDVVNETTGKNCRVCLTLLDEADGSHYHITRTRKGPDGNSLTFTRTTPSAPPEDFTGVDMPTTQNTIEQFFGQSFDLFCNSSYFTQDNVKPFCSATDKELKRLFMEAMDLGRFSDACIKARADLSTHTTQLATFQHQIDLADTAITGSQGNLISYQREHTQFDVNKAATLADLATRLQEAQDSITQAQADVSALEEAEKELLQKQAETAALAPQQKELDDSHKTTQAIQLNQAAIAQKKQDTERRIVTLEAELKTASSRIGTDCGECGKKVEAQDVAAIITALEQKLPPLKTALASFQSVLDKTDKFLTEQRVKEAALRRSLDLATQAISSETWKIQTKIAKYKATQTELPRQQALAARIQDSITAETAKNNPFTALIVAAENTIKTHQEAKDKATEQLETLKNEIAHLEYLITAFGYSGIPSMLLDSAVPFLDKQSNHYATILSDGEMMIRFSTLSTTKTTGKVRDKFSIEVMHTKGGGSYRKASGGEKRRADICVAQAVQDLVRNQGKRPIDFAFYDEPFEHLDAQGVNGVIEILEEVAKSVGTLLTVTHDPNLKALFPDSIKVVKGIDGFSKIV